MKGDTCASISVSRKNVALDGLVIISYMLRVRIVGIGEGQCNDVMIRKLFYFCLSFHSNNSFVTSSLQFISLRNKGLFPFGASCFFFQWSRRCFLFFSSLVGYRQGKNKWPLKSIHMKNKSEMYFSMIYTTFTLKKTRMSAT